MCSSDLSRLPQVRIRPHVLDVGVRAGSRVNAYAGVEPQIVHVPSDVIAAFDAEVGAGLLGDKAHSVIFDNSKIKRLVPDFAAPIPFSQGAREIVAWFDADPARQVVEEQANHLFDRIIAAYEAIRPVA